MDGFDCYMTKRFMKELTEVLAEVVQLMQFSWNRNGESLAPPIVAAKPRGWVNKFWCLIRHFKTYFKVK